MANFTYEFAFSIYEGDKKQLRLKIRDADDNPIMPSILNDVWFTAKVTPGGDNAVQFQKKLTVSGEIVIEDDAAGECLINIVPADTATLASDGSQLLLTCFVKLFDSDDNPYTLRVGTLTVLPE
jgi:hypothetical protein